MTLGRDVAARVDADLGETIAALAVLAERHRADPAAARTLTQHAVPDDDRRSGRGLAPGACRRAWRSVARWLMSLPAQLGGAAGTLAAFVEQFGRRPRRRPACPVRRRTRARSPACAVAHRPPAGHRARRRARSRRRRTRGDRHGCRDARAHRDRRGVAGRRRRLERDAAEAEPRRRRAHPLGRAARAGPRRAAAPGRGARGRRASGRRMARRMAGAASSCCSSPPARHRVAPRSPTGWGSTPSALARTSR